MNDARLSAFVNDAILNNIAQGCLGAVLEGGETWAQFKADAERRMGCPWSEVKTMLDERSTALGVEPTNTELLDLDIDIRLRSLWAEAARFEHWDLAAVAAFMRAAYGKGYTDALSEGKRGTLCTDHGYRVPSVR